MKNPTNTMNLFQLYDTIDAKTCPIEHVISLLNLLVDTYNLDAIELTEDEKYNLCAGASTLGNMLNLAADTLTAVTNDIKALAPEVKRAHAQESAASAN